MFRDRTQAASLLAQKLKPLNITSGIVLAIPRGGVPIGFVIANQLGLPLDLLMSKKIGFPGNPEFAIGSVTIQDVVLDDMASQVSQEYVTSEVERIRKELGKRYSQFTKGRKPCEIKGRNVLVVDDGLATGNTMQACIKSLRKQDPKSILVAVPVSSRSAAEKIADAVDHFVCLEVPEMFYAVGEFYDDFSEVTDKMVRDLMAESSSMATAS